MQLVRNASCDDAVEELVKDNPNLAVPWYLSASLAYYHWDEHILADVTYDWLCRVLTEHWDTIEHRHKRFITMDPEARKVASGFNVPFEQLPTIIVRSTRSLILQCNAERLAAWRGGLGV
jgi:hypothetical protein